MRRSLAAFPKGVFMIEKHYRISNSILKAKNGFCFLLLLLVLSACTASPASISSPTNAPNQAETVDTYVKIFTGVIAGLGALFGLPLTFLQFRKTRAEIRKLELEAKALESRQVSIEDVVQPYRIVVSDSRDVTVAVLADPRYLGPLLLLLDFIVAWIVLSLANYALGVFLSGAILTLIVGLLALFLLVPILREAKHLKRVLRPDVHKEEHRKPESGG
jgi:hypothetical protein